MHEPSSAYTNSRNFQLFHDVHLEMIESQMSPNVIGRGNATMGEEVEEIVTRKKTISRRKEAGHQFQN